MVKDSLYGMRIATALNIWEVVDELGVRPWKLIEEPTVVEYLARDLDDRQRAEVERFCPKQLARVWETPNGKRATHFGLPVLRNYSIVFSIIPGGFVPVTAQFRPNTKDIDLHLPSGAVGTKANPQETVEESGFREHREETGIALAAIELLRSKPAPITVGHTGEQISYLLGYVREPIEAKGLDLEEGEFLKAILVPVDDWIKLCKTKGPDSVSIAATFMGLRQLRR